MLGPASEKIISFDKWISLQSANEARGKGKSEIVTTSAIVQSLRSLVNNYDSRNSWWREAIWKYDIFMGSIRPYWLKHMQHNYQKLLRSEKFIKEMRRVVGAFGMDSRGSQLTGFGLFSDATSEAGRDFDLLKFAKVRLETLKLKEKVGGESVGSIMTRIFNLFSQTKRLSLSGGAVIASKTMHMIMPELFIIVDSRIAKRLNKISDYYPHPSDGNSWNEILPNWDGYKLNPFASYDWDLDQRYLAALMYYKRLILEWCQQNNTDISNFLKLGTRIVITDIAFRTKTQYTALPSRIIDMALW